MKTWRVALFAAMLSAAGIPLYIHLPYFAATELGLGLATVSAVLIGIRLMDFAQDPLLGYMVDRFRGARAGFAALGVFGLAFGFLMLFAIPPQTNATLWLVMSLVVVFSSYSLASILFYAQGVALVGDGPDDAHYSLAGYRETGLILGIVAATAIPSLLQFAGRTDTAYRDFGILVAGLAIVLGFSTRRLWEVAPVSVPDQPKIPWRSGVPRLLALALVNAMPVAITSTLFVFFVEARLDLPDYTGIFLLIFFAAAGASAPVWSRLVRRYGVRPVLLPAMVLSILVFVWTAILSSGVSFAVICVLSGLTLGADMVILPALFATVLARNGLAAGAGFGLWSFFSKLSLALAAAITLPALEIFGFRAGGANPPEALSALTIAYAVLPCLLKVAAIVMVLTLPREDRVS